MYDIMTCIQRLCLKLQVTKIGTIDNIELHDHGSIKKSQKIRVFFQSISILRSRKYSSEITVFANSPIRTEMRVAIRNRGF